MRLAEMRNIGVINEAKLVQVGVRTPEALIELGAENVFMEVYHLVDKGSCLHLLYALEGAIQDIPKRELSERRKEELRNFYQQIN